MTVKYKLNNDVIYKMNLTKKRAMRRTYLKPIKTTFIYGNACEVKENLTAPTIYVSTKNDTPSSLFNV